MRHFLTYIAVVFAGLFLVQYFKSMRDVSREQRPVVRVFGPSSFVSQWGPGPWLKQEFEKTCECRVEYVDGADSTILFQRMKSEARSGVDVVIGMDQYDLDVATATFDWKKLTLSQVQFEEAIKGALANHKFVPYDWGVLAFVLRKSEQSQLPHRLDDLLSSDWAGQIAMEDPRTSSPGLQFLLWLIQARGEDSAFDYLRKLNRNVKSYSASWSMAYGLFSKKQVKTVFSYTTSPVFHLLEEKDTDVIAVEFEEGHPLQMEFAGVPSQCHQCDLAEKFIALMLTPEGQKLIMEKNYMFPAVAGVMAQTPFANIPPFRRMAGEFSTTPADRERILKRWSALRRME